MNHGNSTNVGTMTVTFQHFSVINHENILVGGSESREESLVPFVVRLIYQPRHGEVFTSLGDLNLEPRTLYAMNVLKLGMPNSLTTFVISSFTCSDHHVIAMWKE